MKYLGVKIDENLNWKDQTYDIVTMLNRANALLHKIRNYVSFIALKAIYFAVIGKYRIKHNPKMNIFLVLNKNPRKYQFTYGIFRHVYYAIFTLVENGIINVSKYSVCELVFSMVFI